MQTAPALPVVLILGARLGPDGPSPALVRRARHAARLWRDGRAGLLIPCGGGSPTSEAGAIAAILLAEGVPEDAILTEDLSRTTWENLRNAADLLHRRGQDPGPVLLVTDLYHLPRALLSARAFGLRARGATPGLGGARLLPQLKGAAREVPALALYAARWLRHRSRNRH